MNLTDIFIYLGNIIPTSTDAIYIARHSALKAGVPIHVPALAVNRLCGSGFQSIVSGAQDISLGDAKVALCGGTESMSLAPFVTRDIRFGVRLGEAPKFEDALWSGLTDSYCNSPMAITAENLAEQYKISREEVDKFALSSQHRWQAAHEAGHFKDEIAPVTFKTKKGEEVFSVDEHPRGKKATIEELAKLPPVFKKNGTVTAGSASGVCDGAGAVILANEEAVKQFNLKPLARLVTYSSVGVEPKIMGIGPVNAIKNVLQKAKLSVKDIDVVEINEAFGSQFLACQKELGLDLDKTNVNGGAIAIGHPLAASGSRITANLVYELR